MWVWVNSGGCWWTGRPGVLQFMGSQRVGHDWVTEQLNWTEYKCNLNTYMQWKHLWHRHGVIVTTNKICSLCQELGEMLWKTRPLLVLAYWYSHLCLGLNFDTEPTLVCSSPTTLSYLCLSQRSYKELRHCLTGCRVLMSLCSYGRRPLPCLWDSLALTACAAPLLSRACRTVVSV